MFNNILKILVLLIIFSINPSYSKIENNTDFKVKNLSSKKSLAAWVIDEKKVTIKTKIFEN